MLNQIVARKAKHDIPEWESTGPVLRRFMTSVSGGLTTARTYTLGHELRGQLRDQETQLQV